VKIKGKIMDKQRVSIAMCTYNGAQYLQEQLDSIAGQTRLPDELVICDDRSSDSTIEIIRSFTSNASFSVRLYVNEENLGLCKNREKAISLSTGDIIVLSDWDDVWKPNKIEKIVECFIRNPEAGYIFSDAELVNEELLPLGCTLWESLKFNNLLKEYSHHNDQVQVLLKKNLVWGATLAFRSSIKNIILPISPFYYLEDAWIALLASCTGFYGVPLSDSLLYYRQRTAQVVGGKDTLFKKFNRARNPQDVDIFKKQVQGLLDAKNRLLTVQDSLVKDISRELKLIEEKANHFSNRASIRSSNNFPLKVKAIVSEIVTGKYHRFSNSWQSVVKDLLF
jgi:glycosyltransferase involved in cell wall biosynthesis